MCVHLWMGCNLVRLGDLLREADIGFLHSPSCSVMFEADLLLKVRRHLMTVDNDLWREFD